jgi:hypothetical protein
MPASWMAATATSEGFMSFEEECSLKSMANSNGESALELLLTSTRIDEDISKHLASMIQRRLLPIVTSQKDLTNVTGGSEKEEEEYGSLNIPFSFQTPLQVIVRPWIHIPRYSELRGFIHNSKLTALSQYYTSEYFPELLENQKEIALKAQEFVEYELGPNMPMPHAVVDLCWIPSSSSNASMFKVIELNPFGRSSGSALFHWIEDKDVLFGLRPFEVRMSDEKGHS